MSHQCQILEVVKIDRDDPDPELDVSKLESLLEEAKSIKGKVDKE